jgi:hypothetical protein
MPVGGRSSAVVGGAGVAAEKAIDARDACTNAKEVKARMTLRRTLAQAMRMLRTPMAATRLGRPVRTRVG